MAEKKRSHPRDLNQLAKSIVDAATEPESPPDDDADAAADGKNPAAVALGCLGGLKGGRARAEKLSPEERREIARKAAKSRWEKNEKSGAGGTRQRKSTKSSKSRKKTTGGEVSQDDDENFDEYPVKIGRHVVAVLRLSKDMDPEDLEYVWGKLKASMQGRLAGQDDTEDEGGET